MRKLIRHIIQILDGTPADYGKHQTGQSLVELALITPILIILIMSLVEVGWFANNYLILLEVSRVGARRGTVLTGDLSPLVWNNHASLHPEIPGQAPLADDEHALDPFTYRSSCPPPRSAVGFFNLIACQMLDSMDPLEFRQGDVDGNDVDDIVVSVFSLQAIDRDLVDLKDPYPGAPTGVNAVVVGRFPSNANECNLTAAGAVSAERDPFDWSNNQDDDEDQFNGPNHTWYDPVTTGYREKQRGFVWSGQHVVTDNPNCYGSEWTIHEVEQLMNLPSFGLLPAGPNETRDKLPNQGLVLVEMFWQHNVLLPNPVFNLVFNMLGSSPTISVWAAFPVPAAEPRIRID